jgi:hypothetical protein
MLPITTLAIWVGVLCGAAFSGELQRHAGRLLVEVPPGGLTQTTPPESVSTWSQAALGLILTVEVAGRGAYADWERAFTALRDYPSNAGAYHVGTLPRSDRYLWYTVSMAEKYGLPKRDGKWTQSRLVFSSNTPALAARLTLEGPSLHMGAISADLEQIFSSARLTDAAVEDRAQRDPRIEFDPPAGFALSDLPARTFRFKHERLPLNLSFVLSDPKKYDSWESLMKISARVWRPGTLPRSDQYFYYSVRDAYPEFKLAFRE